MEWSKFPKASRLQEAITHRQDAKDRRAPDHIGIAQRLGPKHFRRPRGRSKEPGGCVVILGRLAQSIGRRDHERFGNWIFRCHVA